MLGNRVEDVMKKKNNSIDNQRGNKILNTKVVSKYIVTSLKKSAL
jgi:hypothetical protein